MVWPESPAEPGHTFLSWNRRAPHPIVAYVFRKYQIAGTRSRSDFAQIIEIIYAEESANFKKFGASST